MHMPRPSTLLLTVQIGNCTPLTIDCKILSLMKMYSMLLCLFGLTFGTVLRRTVATENNTKECHLY